MARKRTCPFPVRYKEGKEVKSTLCLYKIWADEKFMIWKGLSLTQSVSIVSETIHRALSKPLHPGSVFEKLMAEIEANRCLFIEVEPILYPTTALDLLKAEHLLLQSEKENPQCLNVVFEPYLPKWLPVTAVNNYNEWKINNNK